MRTLLSFTTIALAACAADHRPPPSAAPQLARSSGAGEVRLRCGSDRLRAKIRQGQVEVLVGNGNIATLTPLDGSASASNPTYGDGRLTLYKVREPDGWALAQADKPGEAIGCTRERASN